MQTYRACVLSAWLLSNLLVFAWGLWLYNDIHDFIIPYIYKNNPTYRLSPADFSTRERKGQICMTLGWLCLIPRVHPQWSDLVCVVWAIFFSLAARDAAMFNTCACTTCMQQQCCASQASLVLFVLSITWYRSWYIYGKITCCETDCRAKIYNTKRKNNALNSCLPLNVGSGYNVYYPIYMYIHVN